MLCSGSTGIPLFDPTLFALTELRARNRSSATIEQSLRSIMVFYLALQRLGIDLEVRLAQRKLLELGEIEEVVRSCRCPLAATSAPVEPTATLKNPKLVSLEKARMAATVARVEEVGPGTAAIRLHYLRGYLRWLVDKELLKLAGSRDQDAYAELAATGEIVLRALGKRAPALRSQGSASRRQGLPDEALARLREVIRPSAPDNPWKGEHARERNALIIRWLLDLGLRRGELLGLKIENINFQTHEVRIDRRADDPEDPRRNQPNTKTLGRLLPLSEELTQLTHRYITSYRCRSVGSRRHSFLFIAVNSGAPMALSALNKIFVVLRRKCADLPEDLTTHVLRHTWNDLFSATMDQQKVPEESEKKMRSRLMGWSETLGTAATYTRRHVQRKAREVSLALQRNLSKGRTNDA